MWGIRAYYNFNSNEELEYTCNFLMHIVQMGLLVLGWFLPCYTCNREIIMNLYDSVKIDNSKSMTG